jgi:hypothetical protein
LSSAETDPDGSRPYLSALQLGCYTDDGPGSHIDKGRRPALGNSRHGLFRARRAIAGESRP